MALGYIGLPIGGVLKTNLVENAEFKNATNSNLPLEAGATVNFISGATKSSDYSDQAGASIGGNGYSFDAKASARSLFTLNTNIGATTSGVAQPFINSKYTLIVESQTLGDGEAPGQSTFTVVVPSSITEGITKADKNSAAISICETISIFSSAAEKGATGEATSSATVTAIGQRVRANTTPIKDKTITNLITTTRTNGETITISSTSPTHITNAA